MRVGEAPLGELVARPFVGALHGGRSGEARPDHVGELALDLHHLGVAEALLTNLGHYVQVDGVGGGSTGRQQVGGSSDGKSKQSGGTAQGELPAKSESHM